MICYYGMTQTIEICHGEEKRKERESPEADVESEEVEVEEESEEEEDTSPPIKVGEKQSVAEIRRRIRSLMVS